MTDEARRSQGYGAEVLAWLVERARETGCDRLDLDSGLTRGDAHRFYADQGLSATALHFALALGDEVDLGSTGPSLAG